MPQYSNSRIECYENCPRRFKLRYIDKIKPPDFPEGIEAFLGSRVHETLEKLYKDQKISKLNSLEEILAYYKCIWDKNWNNNVKIVRKEYKPENYFNAGIKQLSDYYEKQKPFDQTYTIGTEIMISFDLNAEGGYKMIGYIDRLSHNGKGRYEIHDYKTGQSSMTQQQADDSRQLAIYQIYVEENYPDAKEILLIWHYLAENREVVSKRSKEQIEKLKNELLKSIREIEVENDYFPKESALCDWCEYIEICPAKKHGAILEKLEKNEYLNDPGLVLVEKYGKQYELFEDVGKDLEKMKDALMAFAIKENLSVVMGEKYRVNVRSEKKSHFPNKNEDGRVQLENLIKSYGKWDEVSDLNAFSLLKSYTGWDDEIVEKLKGFITTTSKDYASKPYKLFSEK